MTIDTAPSGNRTRQPAYYIPHGGGPCFFMGPDRVTPPPFWQPMADFLSNFIPKGEGRPHALLIISAHWEAPAFTVHNGTKPSLYYDYYGFPEHCYSLRWDAPGAPALAEYARDLIAQAGLPTGLEDVRGWDHGVFIPMMLAAPEADIPTFEIALKEGLDPAAHIALGEAIAPLRDKGVMIIGSGMSFHNMRVQPGEGLDLAADFDGWLTAAATHADPAERKRLLAHWHEAPAARFAHPREEHLIPLMAVAGAAGVDQGVQVYSEKLGGWAQSAYRFG